MSPTPRRRSSAKITTTSSTPTAATLGSALLAVLATALLAVATAPPASARTIDTGRMPATATARALGSAATPLRASASVPIDVSATARARLGTSPKARSIARIPASDPAVAEVVRLVNVARRKAGCAALRSDAQLATAARLHSEDMARNNYFSHTSLDGRTPWDRIRAQGYTAGAGENIAAGYTTPAAVMDGWMNSAGHKANILNCSFKAIGVGIGHGGSYGTYWTQDFGSR